MLSAVKLMVATLSLLQVKVTTLDDAVVAGTDVKLDQQQVTLITDSGPQTLPLADVLSIELDAEDAAGDATIAPGPEIGLINGSRLFVAELTATAESVQARSAELGELQIPRSAVRYVRLQPPKEEWQTEWNAYLARSSQKDRVIVPKRDGSGLDFLSGVIVSMNDQTMPFLLDGDEIPVPRDRVYGIVFGQSTDSDRDANETSSVVRLRNGAQLAVNSVALQDGQLQLTTSWGQPLTVSADLLSMIDFTGGRVHYLSDLDPLRETYFGLSADDRWGPLFEQDRSTRTGLSRMWKMSRNRFPNNGQPPLSLRGRTFARGLCIFPSARIEYALDRKYKSLKATVGVDDEVAFNQTDPQSPSRVALKIEADGKVVFEQLIEATADPLPVELDLSGVSTLALIVDFGDGSGVCDYLDIVNPALLVQTEGK